MRREKILLPIKESINSTDSDLYLSLDLNNQNDFLPLQNLQEIVSNYEVFLNERAASYDYRIYGNINLIATNVLCELDGELGYEGVESARNFDVESQTYAFDLNEVLFKDNGWYYYIRGGNNCIKYELEPQKNRFDLKNKSDWGIFVTYPAKKDHKILYFNDIPLSDGIAIVDGNTIEVDGKDMFYMVTPIQHNLSDGDKINIYDNNGLVTSVNIYKTGLNNNTYKKNVFVVDEFFTTVPNFFVDKFRFKKVVGDIESEYFSVWNKKITTVEQYEIFKTSYCQNIFSDKNVSYIFPKSLNIESILDYMDRPLTELYTTIIKITDNNFWGEVFSGTNTYLSGIDYDFNTIYQDGTLKKIENNIDGDEDYYFLGIREFNSKTFIESEISFAVHVFNSNNRIDNNLIEGYYYKPHYKIQIKSFTDYIVREDQENIPPQFAVQINGINQWRNILPLDNIPFLNKNHYLYNNINVFIRRQDPCEIYGLSFNRLIQGSCTDIDNEKILDITKIC